MGKAPCLARKQLNDLDLVITQLQIKIEDNKCLESLHRILSQTYFKNEIESLILHVTPNLSDHGFDVRQIFSVFDNYNNNNDNSNYSRNTNDAADYKHIDMISVFSDLRKLQLINVRYSLLKIDLTMDWVINIFDFVEKLNKLRINNKTNQRLLSIGLKLNVVVPGLSGDDTTWTSMKNIFHHVLKLIKLKIPIDLKIEKYDCCQNVKQIEQLKRLFENSYKKHFVAFFGDDGNGINLIKPNCNDKRFWHTMQYEIQTAIVKCLSL